MTSARPTLLIAPGYHKRADSGHPWLYSNEIVMDAAAKALPAGTLVTLKTQGSKTLGVASFNPHTLISARLLDRDGSCAIDRHFFARRLERALSLRQRLYPDPFYRLIHAEADGLPGIIADRFGEVLVCQINTAGMAALEEPFLAACEAVLAPKAIVLRNDSSARTQEGLGLETRIVRGTLDGPIELRENGGRFLADSIEGQKTGWFYDQRDNRRFVAGLAGQAARVLDLYCFTGGFAVEAARAGAREVVGLDRSESALGLAARAAALNGVAAACHFERGEAFTELERRRQSGERFDIVIADPPAFVKSKKDLGPGLRGYRKLCRLASSLVAKNGILFIASCSHNVTPEAFAEAVRRGLEDGGREGRIILSSGAAPDHPAHPWLPESAYLKAETLVLD